MPDGAWNVWGWLWLWLLLGLAVLLIAGVVLEPTPPEIDTQATSGVHVTFVVVAPYGVPSPEYVEAVKTARTAYKRATTEAGCFFSTVGISQHWIPEEGLGVLRRFGHFDEVIVGRNWFNSGVQLYVTDLGSVLEIPQVVAVIERIEVSETWWESTGPKEIGRYFGESGLAAWEKKGSPISVDTRVCSGFETEGSQ
jgi:hypothetical protein